VRGRRQRAGFIGNYGGWSGSTYSFTGTFGLEVVTEVKYPTPPELGFSGMSSPSLYSANCDILLLAGAAMLCFLPHGA